MDKREVAMEQRDVVHVAARAETRETVVESERILLPPEDAHQPGIGERIAQDGSALILLDRRVPPLGLGARYLVAVLGAYGDRRGFMTSFYLAPGCPDHRG